MAGRSNRWLTGGVVPAIVVFWLTGSTRAAFAQPHRVELFGPSVDVQQAYDAIRTIHPILAEYLGLEAEGSPPRFFLRHRRPHGSIRGIADLMVVGVLEFLTAPPEPVRIEIVPPGTRVALPDGTYIRLSALPGTPGLTGYFEPGPVLSVWILRPSDVLGELPWLLMSPEAPGEVTWQVLFAHEVLGHARAMALRQYEIVCNELNTDGAALYAENWIRKMQHPGSPLRLFHNPPDAGCPLHYALP